jgi:hypothetical protein
MPTPPKIFRNSSSWACGPPTNYENVAPPPSPANEPPRAAVLHQIFSGQKLWTQRRSQGGAWEPAVKNPLATRWRGERAGVRGVVNIVTISSRDEATGWKSVLPERRTGRDFRDWPSPGCPTTPNLFPPDGKRPGSGGENFHNAAAGRSQGSGDRPPAPAPR